ncbi:GNAT family N-acetyltransferase [Nocardia pseudobrasiliensis]|uniref:Acetyltransferase (GNAT) family protein n=1 Tax=Nocardia pseudobrasiliensis TaxID=45979 RepID=A0A370IC58_9NOCA|nr:GNAT family N-acetyltransferase [Nocardia pseudobrasiliensis]RDI68318.1 acetyltransferase (GNAT) family protein [Nocardia pseudobrasiliensis]
MSADIITFRQLGPDDVDAVRELHTGLNERESYFRFFGPLPHQLGEMATALAQRDPAHCAVGAYRADQLIGMANFIALEGNRDAEAALVVTHDEQDHGIGTQLLEHLAQLARERGRERLVAQVLPNNSRMLRLLMDCDLPVTAHLYDGVVEIVIRL